MRHSFFWVHVLDDVHMSVKDCSSSMQDGLQKRAYTRASIFIYKRTIRFVAIGFLDCGKKCLWVINSWVWFLPVMKSISPSISHKSLWRISKLYFQKIEWICTASQTFYSSISLWVNSEPFIEVIFLRAAKADVCKLSLQRSRPVEWYCHICVPKLYH